MILKSIRLSFNVNIVQLFPLLNYIQNYVLQKRPYNRYRTYLEHIASNVDEQVVPPLLIRHNYEKNK